tara:strand:+ start:691 stop:1161 length:471 start_codon:yes stop_codon:yes gene_type:complete
MQINNQTVIKNNTMQFKPTKNDCDYIHDFTMVELSSYYFSNNTRKIHNSKIKRVLLCDLDKYQRSNIFSYYGPNPYQEVITVLIEEVKGFDDSKEYKIILLHKYKIAYNKNVSHLVDKVWSGFQVVRFKDYQQARKELNRLEEELKTSLDCLKDFK